MSAQVSLVDFYRRHGISPVRQDITDLETHFTRRAGLYRHLGLLPGFLKGRSAIEIGPGSGFNSLYTATLEPSRYVLLEGNPKGVADIDTLFERFESLRNRIDIVAGLMQDYETAERFDFVFCEGMLALAGVPDPVALLRRVARLAAPGGVLVITTIDALSDFAEMLRRLIAQLILDPAESLAAQVARLTPVFSPHLSTLSGMSRRYDDWVVDNLLNPASIGPYLTIPDAIAALSDDFELFGASPKFIVDWRWYKAIVPGQTRQNEIGVEQYWRNAHNLLDYRALSDPRSGDENRRLYALCESVRDLTREFESNRNRSIVDGIRARLRDISSAVAGFNPDVAQAVTDVDALLSDALPASALVAVSPRFAPWFGRGQQYLSFSRNQSAWRPPPGRAGRNADRRTRR